MSFDATPLNEDSEIQASETTTTTTETTTTAPPFASLLGTDGLEVLTKTDDGYIPAITSKSFVTNLDSSLYPDAVLTVHSISAIQVALRFCQEYSIKVCVRTGGHSWHAIWLQGPGTIILDVGSINHVETSSKLVTVGCGVKNLNDQLPDQVFFPSGHCPDVPIGGYILGCGYGLGWTRYGLACTLVQQVTVVLASGETKTIQIAPVPSSEEKNNNEDKNNNKEDEDDAVIQAAIRHLLRGSYHHFPAVITSFTLRTFATPHTVLAPLCAFQFKDWKLAIQLARDISHRAGDQPQLATIEPALVVAHCPPPIAQATGVQRMIGVHCVVYSDDDYDTTLAFVNQVLGIGRKDEVDEEDGSSSSRRRILDAMIVPPGPMNAWDAKRISAEFFAPAHPPNRRYYTDAYQMDEHGFDMKDEEMQTMMEPLIRAWESKTEFVPAPPSSSVVTLAHPSGRENNTLATGFSPSFCALSWPSYTDPNQDEAVRDFIQRSMQGFAQNPHCYTELPEGNVRSGKSGFTKSAKMELQEKLKLLDPHGIFAKPHVST